MFYGNNLFSEIKFFHQNYDSPLEKHLPFLYDKNIKTVFQAVKTAYLCMDHSITILSEKEKAILESYMLSADGLAEFWGENCEVIIHDLTQLDASVVKIVNGHLSGRQVGAPISEVTLNFVNKMMATTGSHTVHEGFPSSRPSRPSRKQNPKISPKPL